MKFCVNCSIKRILGGVEYNTLDVKQKMLLKEWVGQNIDNDDIICAECQNMLNNSINTGELSKKLGHLQVCHCCGVSVYKKQFKSFSLDDPIAQTVLKENPRKLEFVIVCHKCSTRINRNIHYSTRKSESEEQNKYRLRNNKLYAKDESDDPTYICDQKQASSSDISLVNYKRAAARKDCIIPQCKSGMLQNIPKFIKEMFLIDYNIFIPNRVRICEEHLKEADADWDMVANRMSLTTSFTTEHVEQALDTLKRRRESAVDFECVEYMPDSLCKFLTGLRVSEFMELHDSIIWSAQRSKTGLAILLIKLKRESNVDAIAELLGLSKPSVSKELTKAIDCVCDSDKAFFDDNETLSHKINSQFLSIYAGQKGD